MRPRRRKAAPGDPRPLASLLGPLRRTVAGLTRALGQGRRNLGRLLHGSALPSLALGTVLLAACAEDSAPKRPHVVLISIDTLRRDHVGHYGYERDTTPVLDALAEESLVFDRAYTTMSFTLIAHMSMLTGLYPSQHGVYHERLALPTSVPTLAQRLQDRGYHTIGLYRPGWLDGRYGFDRGFDHYESHYKAAEADRHLRAALEQRRQDRPLFLFVHLFDVHSGNVRRPDGTIYEPPAPFDEAFLPDAVERVLELDVATTWDDSSGVTPEQHEAIVALYDGGIRYVDDLLGSWFDLLRDEGLFDDAIVIVTSDHGESLNQRGRKYSGHGGVFEEGLAVPLLIRFPDGRWAGERSAEPVSHVDLLPTLLDQLGFPPDAKLPGTSLLAEREETTLLYAERPKRVEVFLRWPWKLVLGSSDRGTFLYNLEEDPLEREPLRPTGKTAERFREVTEPLLEAVEAERERWYRPAEANPNAESATPEVEADLRALGYLEDED